MNPEAEVKVDYDKVTVKYDDTIGFVTEVGYQPADNFWINIRYVAEQYEPTDIEFNGLKYTVNSSAEISGNHVGINAVMMF
ncbi:MAG: hypothetical protein H7A00_03680 [Hahellaceae bacterium]|nr:hypothetical protein [Hahellaceae bacterium]